eukprot:CAMPEP_0183297532 /NCGR_PEP_ID=MMETSP0160_2-20130417/4810_1 /TAXON_ID=2839 ORGANISM="Odontella Sinensis, Strain Grunow 1884" /NCGR_SAMPLE_ID=MMETSP0160_2 /ASSEMBLY_ACC=CAM_ASM_000250 /LENGTH=696 /DNA_ID=CAMNT_0025459381 /DNA_START=45 /DNA_END=2135 /DNA_ORIENTATION=-
MTESAGDGVPHHLMPVAAVLGTYALFGGIRALYQVYANVRHDPKKVTAEMRLKGQLPKPLKSGQFAFLVLSVAASVLAYGYVTALVNNAVAASDVFDPYDVLSIEESANSTVVKQAYRTLSKLHHPDKGGDEKTFHKIASAYKALTDPIAKENWEKYGHPDGPQRQTLSFALPDWLLHPEGSTAAVLLVLYLGMFIGLIVYVFRYVRKTEAAATRAELETSVAGADAAYLATHLRPDSSHTDVLFLIATTPENLEMSRKAIERAEEVRAKKMEALKEAKKSSGEMDFDLSDSAGWADEEDDEAAAKAKQVEEEKRKRAAQLAEATGKSQSPDQVKLEGVDDGVLGQKWVENTLAAEKRWPPKDLGPIAEMTFSDGKGNVQTALENAAVRRNLCMTMGRLNAQMLNSHPELVNAGQKGLIDPTYFKSTMEFRQRTGLLLEAALRVSMAVESYRLARTIVETVSMFKIGTPTADDPKTLTWFRDVMKKQYGGEAGLPRLKFLEKDIATPDEDEIATGDTCALSLHIERKHAENFTKQKLALCQKQGIPPQVAMQAYREGWWILIRAKRVDGGEAPVEEETEEKENAGSLMKMLDSETKKKFAEETEENKLLCAWPFIVSNVAQKAGKVNVRFKAPAAPGKYEFMVDVKSQEFLGADEQFSIQKEVLDSEVIARKEKDEEEDEGEEGSDEEEEETKKTK